MCEMTKNVFQNVRKSLMDDIIQKYFSPEYFSEEALFDFTENVLYQLRPSADDVLCILKDIDSSNVNSGDTWMLNISALSNYLVDLFKSGSCESLDPHTFLNEIPEHFRKKIAEYFFEGEIIDYTDNQAWISFDDISLSVSIEDGTMFFKTFRDGSPIAEVSFEVVFAGDKGCGIERIVGCDIFNNYAVLEVLCKSGQAKKYCVSKSEERKIAIEESFLR